MKILIANDSYKESLTASEAAYHIRMGLEKASDSFVITACPVADGGEGTVDAVLASGSECLTAQVSGPLGHIVFAPVGIMPDVGSAVVESASACGLSLVSESERRPLDASTFGVGELIKAALDAGSSRIIVGLGGTSTTDGGCGAAAALGARFLKGSGESFVPSGGTLKEIARIDTTGLDLRLRQAEIIGATDVISPLHGPEGAAFVFAPQKGANSDEVALLNAGLVHLAQMVEKDLGISLANSLGAGAAGGLGFGLMAFLGATLASGFDIVAKITGLGDKIEKADIVITGEGRTDITTLRGKAVQGVVGMCAKAGKPCIILSGSVSDNLTDLYEQGASAIFSISNGPISLQEAKTRSGELLESTSYNIGRMLMLPGIGRQA